MMKPQRVRRRTFPALHKRNLLIYRLHKILLPRHNHWIKETRYTVRSRPPNIPLRSCQLRQPLVLPHIATKRQLRRRGDDAGFAQVVNVTVFLSRHGTVGVLEAGADVDFTLIEHVPVIEWRHEALRWDDEGVVAGALRCLGHEWRHLRLSRSLRDRLDNLVGWLVLRPSMVWA